MNQMQKTITALREKNKDLINEYLSLKTQLEGNYQFQDYLLTSVPLFLNFVFNYIQLCLAAAATLQNLLLQL